MSGKITEVYEYTRPRKEKKDTSMAEDALAYEQSKMFPTVKAKRGTDNEAMIYRRRREMVRRLILANFTRNSRFFTLTMPEGTTDKKVMTEFSRFMGRIQRRSEVQYVAVAERQDNGTLHYHGIANGLSRSMLTDWVGIWDSEKTKDVDNVGAYLIKYMTKDFAKLGKNVPAYKSSRNLVKPIHYYTGSKPQEEGKIRYEKSWVDYYGYIVNYTEYNDGVSHS